MGTVRERRYPPRRDIRTTAPDDRRRPSYEYARGYYHCLCKVLVRTIFPVLLSPCKNGRYLKGSICDERTIFPVSLHSEPGVYHGHYLRTRTIFPVLSSEGLLTTIELLIEHSKLRDLLLALRTRPSPLVRHRRQHTTAFSSSPQRIALPLCDNENSTLLSTHFSLSATKTSTPQNLRPLYETVTSRTTSNIARRAAIPLLLLCGAIDSFVRSARYASLSSYTERPTVQSKRLFTSKIQYKVNKLDGRMQDNWIYGRRLTVKL